MPLLKGSSCSTAFLIYHAKGKSACSAPQLRTAELDQIMAQIFNHLAQDKQAIVDAVVKVIQAVPDEHDYARDVQRLENERNHLSAKKDRLPASIMACLFRAS